MSSDPHGPVVVGVDGSDEALRAAEYGAWEASRRRVPLRLIYARQPPSTSGAPAAEDPARDQGRIHDLLAKAATEVTANYPEVAVTTATVSEGAAAALVAESHRASLVVVGTRATGGPVGHLSGSVAAQVAAYASAPVVVIRPTDNLDDDDPAVFRARPVIVGLDGSEGSEQAMAFAVEQAVAREATIHAVYVWNVADVHDLGPLVGDEVDEADEDAKADRLLTEATSGWSARYPDLIITRRAVHDLNPMYALINAADEAGLVVVGSRGLGGFDGLLLGSTVDGLIRYSPVPVAVVHGHYPARR